MTFRLPFITPNQSPKLFPQDVPHTNIGRFTNPIPVNNSGSLMIPVSGVKLSIGRVYHTNPGMYPNPIPFLNGPSTSNAWGVNDAPPPTYPNLVINSVTVTAPFTVEDFSKPSSVESIPSTVYPNLVLQNFSTPFSTEDFSKPFTPAPAKQDQQAYNINIYTNPIPFGPYDWGDTRQLKTITPDIPPNIVLTTPVVTTLPFNQYIWPNTNKVPNASVDIVNMVLFTAPAQSPFFTQDFAKPFTPVLAKYDQQSLNINLYQGVTASPFIPVDFNKPFVPVPTKPDQQSVNLNLYTNPIPFGPYDWSTTAFFFPHRATDGSVYPPNLLTTTLAVVANPFFTQDFSKPSPVKLTVPTNYPNLVLPNFSTPFYLQDFSKTNFLPSVPSPLMGSNVNLSTNPIPFNQSNWTYLYPVRPIVSDQNNLPNIAGTNPSQPSTPLGIFGWTDWGKTKSPVILIPDQNNLPDIVLIVTPPLPPVEAIPSGKWRWLEDYEKIARQAHHHTADVQKAAAVMSSAGGHARAEALTPKQRTDIASKAASIRWGKK